MKFRPKTKEVPGSGWFDKEAWQEQISYQQNPIRSVAELKKLILEMRDALPKVNAPVLLMHSKDDSYVLPDNVEKIYDGLVNASDKTKLYITGSGHVVTRDAARYQVFESALEFIRRIENPKHPDFIECHLNRNLLFVAVALFLWGFAEGLFFNFQPIYLERLGSNPQQIGLILGAFGMVMAISHIPAGYLADRFGRRPLLFAAWFMCIISTLIMGFARDLALFVAGMLTYGLTTLFRRRRVVT